MSAAPAAEATAVSAIVVNHRRPGLTIECLASLEAALERLGEPAELIAVDNGSGDGSAERIGERFPEARVIALGENLGFAGAVNAGVGESSGEWVLLLNNDTTIEAQAVVRLLAAGRGSDDVGSVAAQMRFAAAPRVVNSAGIGVDRLGVAYDRGLGDPVAEGTGDPVEVFGASGGAALMRRAMLDELGGLDDSFFFALEDVDLAWRARMAGWRSLYVPGAVVWHHHGTTGRHTSAFKHFHVGRNRVRMLAKNAEGSHLRRYGPAIVAYDLAYALYAVIADRTLAPLRGRLRGMREWRAYRRAGEAGRRPVALEPVRGFRAALRRRVAWDAAGPVLEEGGVAERNGAGEGAAGHGAEGGAHE
jgi:GT2 family glycosyltransferase